MMTSNNMVEHHTHYREIHGYDKTVWMTASEHKKLHNRLRREGKCNILSDELNTISRAARCRTDKQKEAHRRYCKSEKGKIATHVYDRTDTAKKLRNNYRSKHVQTLTFNDNMDVNLIHRDTISYNSATGNVSINARFLGNHDKKILMVDI